MTADFDDLESILKYSPFLCQECEFFVEKIDKENKVKTRSKTRGLLGLFG